MGGTIVYKKTVTIALGRIILPTTATAVLRWRWLPVLRTAKSHKDEGSRRRDAAAPHVRRRRVLTSRRGWGRWGTQRPE